jgi:hypothetical protein
MGQYAVPVIEHNLPVISLLFNINGVMVQYPELTEWQAKVIIVMITPSLRHCTGSEIRLLMDRIASLDKIIASEL